MNLNKEQILTRLRECVKQELTAEGFTHKLLLDKVADLVIELTNQPPKSAGVKEVEEYLNSLNSFYPDDNIGEAYFKTDVEKALTAQAKDFEEQISQIRTSVAEYMRTEGCSCCQDRDGHKKAESTLGELLNAPKYSDDSGYDFSQFRNQKPRG